MLLNFVAMIVIFIYVFRNYEGLTTYTKYKEIKDKFEHEISEDTDCIYTQISPQISKIYNFDYTSPFDRYKNKNINSEYNKPYYNNDNTIDLDIDVTTQIDNQIMPYYKTYTYCELSNNETTCNYTTCGIPEETHNKLVADFLYQKKMEMNDTIKQNVTNEINSNLNNYNNNNIITTNYLDSIKK